MDGGRRGDSLRDVSPPLAVRPERPGVLRRALSTLRAEGPRATLHHALARGVRRRLLVLERETGAPWHVPETDLRLDLRRVEDVAAAARLRPDADHAALARVAASGAHLLGAFHDGRLVSTRWIAFDEAWIEYLGGTLVLPPTDAYAFDSYTVPELRRRHVNAALSRFSQEYARAAGRTTCLGCVLPENRAAVAAALRYGYRPAGCIGWTGIGPLRRWHARRDGARLAWSPSAGPR